MSNKIEYRNFCKTVEDLPVFAQDWYLDAVCVDGTWDVAIIKKGNEIIATMPYFIKQKIGFSYSTIPLHVRHLGPYLVSSKRNLKNEHLLYAELIEQLPKTAHFIQDFAPMVTNWLPFYWKGFKQSVRYTYTIRLEDLAVVYKNMSRNVKRNIKKAKDIMTITHDISLETYYEINKMSFVRQNLPIYYSLESFKRLNEATSAHNSSKIFATQDEEGNIHAVGYLVWDKVRSYALLGGINSEFRDTSSMMLLVWEMILYTKEVLNLPIFDFAGSMLPQIEPSRRQFGAVQEPYFRVWKYGSKVFEVMSGVKEILKK